VKTARLNFLSFIFRQEETDVPDIYVNGIDVSHFNGTVDWSRVAAGGIAFAYAKATEGMHTRDARFEANYDGIKASNLLRGAYHFFHAELDAAAQANNFLSVVSALAPGDLPPMLDVEAAPDGLSAASIAAGVRIWLDAVQQALGRTPVLYTSASFSKEFSVFPLWVAHYTTRPSPNLPAGFSDFTFWQFDEHQTVDGISGSVDMDRFNGSLEDLKQLSGLEEQAEHDAHLE
jgi:lysozyme